MGDFTLSLSLPPGSGRPRMGDLMLSDLLLCDGCVVGLAAGGGGFPGALTTYNTVDIGGGGVKVVVRHESIHARVLLTRPSEALERRKIQD